MSVTRQLMVALVAAVAGSIALGVFWLLAGSDPGYRDVAIGTLVYAAAYVLTVPRAERWLDTTEAGTGTGTGQTA